VKSEFAKKRGGKIEVWTLLKLDELRFDQKI